MDLPSACVGALALDTGDGTTIAVGRSRKDHGVLPEAKRRQMLLAPIAECLTLFRSVDLGKADHVLPLLVVKNGQRVAVGHPHHPSAELPCVSCTCEGDQE